MSADRRTHDGTGLEGPRHLPGGGRGDGRPRAGHPRALLAEIEGAGEEGATADEIARWLGMSPLSVRPRCTELARTGAIRDSGRRRRNEQGNRQIVWVAG